MSSHINAKLVNDALLMALWKRKPKRGLIWHTDRGSQYCSKSHRNIVKDHGIMQRMSRKGKIVGIMLLLKRQCSITLKTKPKRQMLSVNILKSFTIENDYIQQTAISQHNNSRH